MIHYLTNQAPYSLKIEMEDWSGQKKFALYESFLLKSEEDGYELQVSGYSGTAGDSLTSHNGNKFSTFDVDNDDAPIEFWGGNCAKRFHGKPKSYLALKERWEAFLSFIHLSFEKEPGGTKRATDRISMVSTTRTQMAK